MGIALDTIDVQENIKEVKEEITLFGEGIKTNLKRAIKSEYTLLSVLAIIVGVLSGLLAILFRVLIYETAQFFFVVQDNASFAGRLVVIFPPILGGLGIGLLLHFSKGESRGHGISEVMESVIAKKSNINAKSAFLKFVSAVITIGSGGSAGREGTMVHSGASLGSNIANKLHLDEERKRILLGCGVAGGIAGSFNTPIAGVIFAVELILLEFKTRSFIPLVISSVFATIICRTVPAMESITDIPPYTLVSWIELPLYAGLGIAAGLVSIAFTKVMYFFEDFFDKVKIPIFTKPVIGGITVGAIGVAFPHVLGQGYETLVRALHGEIHFMGNITDVYILFILFLIVMLLKIFATSITLGSGASGGTLFPMLFIGCMLGCAYGILVHSIFPNETAEFGAYALVGMAAVFAGASRATLTAMILLFEMTGTYTIILPLMLACVVSDALASSVMGDSLFTLKLKKRGIHVIHDMEPDVLESVLVKEVMVLPKDIIKLRKNDTKETFLKVMEESGHVGFPVVDENDKLYGVVTLTDVRFARRHEKIGKICTKELVTVSPVDNLDTVAHKMAQFGISHIPVVGLTDKRHLVGFITKGDIIYARDRLSVPRIRKEKKRQNAKMGRGGLEPPTSAL